MSERIRAIGAIREHNIRVVLPDSSLCQNGKQVEIITKMIFELCYIEAIINVSELLALTYNFPISISLTICPTKYTDLLQMHGDCLNSSFRLAHLHRKFFLCD